MKIKRITLLNNDQIENNKDLLPDDPHRWWCYMNGQREPAIVHPGFEIENFAARGESCYIRPALVLEDINTERGATLEILCEDWVVLDAYENGALVVCTRCVGKSIYDYRDRIYRQSYVAKWLKRWLRVRMPQWNVPTQKIASAYNRLKMKYTKIIWLSHLIVPLVIIIAAAYLLVTHTHLQGIPDILVRAVPLYLGYGILDNAISFVRAIMGKRLISLGYLFNAIWVVVMLVMIQPYDNYIKLVIFGFSALAQLVIHRALNEF